MDVPFDAGCYEILSPLPGSKIPDTVEVVTPAWCVTKCLESTPSKRFALLTNGEDCYCYEQFPYSSLQPIPSENETMTCTSTCKGTDNYLCGATNAVNAYVGSKKLKTKKGRKILIMIIFQDVKAIG